MAENEQENDEYQFDEFNSIENESMEDVSDEFSGGGGGPGEGEPEGKKNILRNVLIVFGALVVLFIVYRIIASFFGGTTTEVKPAIPPVSQMAPQPVQPIRTIVKETDTELKQKVDTIEQNDRYIQSDLTSLKNQVNTVGSDVANLNTQISKLSQSVTELTELVNKQSMVISDLVVRTKKKPVKRKVVRVPVRVINYDVQAVIPGRAWLIASNGSTLTVRVGTKVPGYGVVKLIDSIQGRVITSSGRIIRFSQKDS